LYSPNAVALQPWTQVHCSKITYGLNSTVETLYFRASNADQKPIWSLSNSTIWEEILIASTHDTASTSLIWVQPPLNNSSDDTQSSAATIGAVVLLPRSDTVMGFRYLTCNANGFWFPATIGYCNPPMYCGAYDTVGNHPTIQGLTEWAAFLNPNISTSTSSSTPAFTDLAELAGISSSNDSTHSNVAEILLATMITDGLARLASSATLQGHLDGAGDPSQVGYPHEGPWVDTWLISGDAWIVDDTAKATWALLRIVTISSGYSYRRDGVGIKLALATFLTHSLFVVIHVAYLLISGKSSGSWDRIVELIALAVNSERTDKLRNTCAGIEKFKTHGLRVKIVPKGEAHLELAFGGGETTEADETVDTPLLVNKRYGNLTRREKSE
jgi:hypothetical protein